MMKSSFYALLLGILVVGLVSPAMTLAASTDPVTSCTLVEAITYNGTSYGKGATINEGVTSQWGAICVLNMMNVVLNWIFTALMILVIIMVLSGAFDLMTAGGDTAKVTTGRKKIMWAAVGLVVALISRAIPSIVRAIFG